MKDFLLEITEKQTGYNAKLNTMREYLQAYILRIMQERGLFRIAAFLGGTALRFLHNLPRYSEDLDFSIQQGKAEALRFLELTESIKKELISGGYEVSLKLSTERNVNYALVKFQGLMYDVKISPLRSQTFSIKVEIDINPPDGAFYETRIITKYFPISFLTYDIPSLFAGKFSALLTRKYTKGRDWYDLLWYLSKFKDLEPNFTMLNNALAQTHKNYVTVTKENWREELKKVIIKLDVEKVKNDVQRFLENQNDVNLLNKENLLNVIRS